MPRCRVYNMSHAPVSYAACHMPHASVLYAMCTCHMPHAKVSYFMIYHTILCHMPHASVSYTNIMAICHMPHALFSYATCHMPHACHMPLVIYYKRHQNLWPRLHRFINNFATHLSQHDSYKFCHVTWTVSYKRILKLEDMCRQCMQWQNLWRLILFLT